MSTTPRPDPAQDPGTLPDTVAELLRSPFDPVLCDPVRLRLQAALHGLPAEASMAFTILRTTLGLSDGNLGAHLAVLVDAGYAEGAVTWRGKRRTTRYAATAAGRAAFTAHVRALESVIEGSRPDTGGDDGFPPAARPPRRPR